MKITFTSKHTVANITAGIHTSRFFLGLAIFCCSLFTLMSTDSTAQATTSVAPALEISTEDYPVIYWKSPLDYSEILLTEKSNTAIKLATPNLPANELGLYTGYERMLSYMQEELSNQTKVETIALKSFTKVVAETPGDAILQNMNTNDFQGLYDALLLKLIK